MKVWIFRDKAGAKAFADLEVKGVLSDLYSRGLSKAEAVSVLRGAIDEWESVALKDESSNPIGVDYIRKGITWKRKEEPEASTNDSVAVAPSASVDAQAVHDSDHVVPVVSVLQADAVPKGEKPNQISDITEWSGDDLRFTDRFIRRSRELPADPSSGGVIDVANKFKEAVSVPPQTEESDYFVTTNFNSVSPEGTSFAILDNILTELDKLGQSQEEKDREVVSLSIPVMRDVVRIMMSYDDDRNVKVETRVDITRLPDVYELLRKYEKILTGNDTDGGSEVIGLVNGYVASYMGISRQELSRRIGEGNPFGLLSIPPAILRAGKFKQSLDGFTEYYRELRSGLTV